MPSKGEGQGEGSVDPKLLKVLHQTIKKVGEDTDTLAFNTAISQMMIFVNEVTAQEKRPRKLLEPFVLLLAPYAPHLAEELWEKLGHKQSLAYEPWPKYDEALLMESTVTVVVQVNGKLRDRIEVPANSSQAELEKLALAKRRACKRISRGQTSQESHRRPRQAGQRSWARCESCASAGSRRTARPGVNAKRVES